MKWTFSCCLPAGTAQLLHAPTGLAQHSYIPSGPAQRFHVPVSPAQGFHIPAGFAQLSHAPAGHDPAFLCPCWSRPALPRPCWPSAFPQPFGVARALRLCGSTLESSLIGSVFIAHPQGVFGQLSTMAPLSLNGTLGPFPGWSLVHHLAPLAPDLPLRSPSIFITPKLWTSPCHLP